MYNTLLKLLIFALFLGKCLFMPAPLCANPARIFTIADGRGREMSIYQMGGAGMNQYDVYVCICLFDLAYHLRLLYFYYLLIMN